MMDSYGSYPPSAATDFIAREEGCRRKAYQCSAGVWTIGYGYTKGVKEGDEITSAEAERLLVEDIAETVSEFSRCVNVPVMRGQFVALTSLAFNLGASNAPPPPENARSS